MLAYSEQCATIELIRGGGRSGEGCSSLSYFAAGFQSCVNKTVVAKQQLAAICFDDAQCIPGNLAASDAVYRYGALWKPAKGIT
jgi:hypothetical protein